MKEINPELVRNLYAKYSPDSDVESKMSYIQEKYKDNQEEFVRNFYAKYDPSVDVDSKLEYINKAYGLKKKEDSEVTSQVEGTVSPTQQVVEESTSVESLPEGVTEFKGFSEEDKKAMQQSAEDAKTGMTPSQISSRDRMTAEAKAVSTYTSFPF